MSIKRYLPKTDKPTLEQTPLHQYNNRMPTDIALNVLIVFTGLFVVWLGILSFLYVKQQHFFQSFTKETSDKDLKDALSYVRQHLKQIDTHLKDLDQTTAALEKNATSHFQKSGFVRFNPYADTGGNQSFCLCLLDEKDNGLLITSYHSREQTRIYCKQVKAGETEHELSKEEKQALKQAKKA